jgi:tetratricopeptide (TPR) repeat protein
MLRFPVFLAFLLFYTSCVFSQAHEQASVYQFADSAIKRIPVSVSRDSARSEIFLALAWKYKTIDAKLALDLVNRAISIADSAGIPYMQARCLDVKGVIYQITTNYTQALYYHLQALRLYQSMNTHTIDQAGCIGNITAMYINMKNYKLAKKYLLELINQGIDHPFLIIAYSNMGVIENDLGNVKESLIWYKKAIAAGERYKDKSASVLALINMAQYYMKADKTDSARYYCHKALNTSPGDPYYLAAIYETLGAIETGQKNYQSALVYLEKARQIAESKGLSLSLIDIYNRLASLYDAMKDTDKSYVYFKKYTALKDSSVNITTSRQIAEMQEKYEAEKKDKEISRLNHARQMAEERVKSENMTRNFFILAFILILIISIALIRNVFLKQRINTVLSDKNELLSIKNNELTVNKAFIESQKRHIEKINLELETFNVKLINENIQAKYEVLKSKVNPHFLFNSLSTLSSIVISDQDMALDYIGRFSELYRIILETEEQQLVSLEKEMNIVENYLYLQKMRFNNSLHVDMNVLSKNIPLGLPPFSIQMSVENAIKHNTISNKNPLKLSVYLAENNLVIKNTLQKNSHNVVSTVTGQKNITDRYKIVTSRKPEFIETTDEYIVRLPLITLLKEVEA